MVPFLGARLCSAVIVSSIGLWGQASASSSTRKRCIPGNEQTGQHPEINHLMQTRSISRQRSTSESIPGNTLDLFDGLKKRSVEANGFTFDCYFGGEDNEHGKKGDVMLLHGFPFFSSMYKALMKELASKGYQSVACDQRGYSNGAKPPNKEDYRYSKLRDDIFAVADAVGFDKFHLVAHDHGALLGWTACSDPRGRERFLSFTGASIPHPDAFSAGLEKGNPKEDLQQQMLSQYFTIFVEDNNSNSASLYAMLGLPSGFFHGPSDFQKAVWWYPGGFDDGLLAMPPSFTSDELREMDAPVSAQAMRLAFGGEKNDGYPQRVKTGNIATPVLYICGSQDSFIACNKPFALDTKNYCPNDYQYLEVKCDHDLFDGELCWETDKVIAGIVHRVESATKAR